MAHPGLKLGDLVPDFHADTTHGHIDFHEWLGDSWGLLLSHPADFTPVCTSELGRVQQLYQEFSKRGVKVAALSCDTADAHRAWIKDIVAYCHLQDFSFPIIADPEREVATKYGMLEPDEKDTAGIPLTCRAVFIIAPNKKLKASILYPSSTGRNFDEIIRVIDALQLTAEKKVATPADWHKGEECMVPPVIGEEDAKKMFPKCTMHEVPSGKGYMRTTPIGEEGRAV